MRAIDCERKQGRYRRRVSHAVAAVVATALATALVLVQPWVGQRRYRRLLESVATHPEARLRHYRRALIGEWSASAAVVLVGLLAGRGAASIGLGLGPHPAAEAAVVAEVAIVLGVSALVFRFGGSGIRDALRRQAKGFTALLPIGRRERLVFAAVAVTAGVCEELIYRGFGIAYLRWLWPTAPRSALIVIAAAAFGAGHLYQRFRGIALTGLVGAYLAWLVLSTGSLLPAMVIHALIDLRILALPDLKPAEASSFPARAASATSPSGGP